MDERMDERSGQAGTDVTLLTRRQKMDSEWCFHAGNQILMDWRMAPVGAIQWNQRKEAASISVW